MNTYSKQLKGLLRNRELVNRMNHWMLVIKNRCEKEMAESDTAGSGVYVAPPSEETHERGPGGAVTPLLYMEPEQIPSEGTLLSAHGLPPDYDPSALGTQHYRERKAQLKAEIAAAEARVHDKSLSGEEVRQALDTVEKKQAEMRRIDKAQLQAEIYYNIKKGFYPNRSKKMLHLLTLGGANRLQSSWNPTAPAESLALSITVLSFLSVTANRLRLGIVTGDAFSDVIDELQELVQAALVAEAAMVANDTTTNKANFKNACAPLHGMLSKILKYLRALGSRVTDNDYYLMGLPALGDNHHSPVPIPSEMLIFVILGTSNGEVDIEIRRPNGKKAKQYGVHGYEIMIKILDGDTVVDIATYEWKEFQSYFTTKSTAKLNLGAANRGKRILITVRAENTKGQKGPTSPTQEFILG